jgi:hypothetical protein
VPPNVPYSNKRLLILERLPQESLSLLRRQWILDKRDEQELIQFGSAVSPGFVQQQFEEINAMKQPIVAEVALFIHRPYA